MLFKLKMLKEILLEMPISNFKRIGDFSIPISYKKEIDRTLLIILKENFVSKLISININQN